MPELPEVEYAKRDLMRWVAGRRVVEAEVPKSRVLRDQAPSKIAQALKGLRATGAERRGKHLLLLFEKDTAIHFHLGMSGFFAQGREYPHARLVLALDDGTEVSFHDARMFGRVELGPTEVLRAALKHELGPDPLLDPFGANELGARLAKTKRPIKLALMDQRLIAGLGNIYASEVLWMSRVHPDQPASTLDAKTNAHLARSIKKAIAASLENLTETEGGYLQDAGSVNPFRVYGREGERCPRCRISAIVKTEQGGRSTFHCPHCQSRPASRPARRDARRGRRAKSR